MKDHPSRYALANELHARPFAAFAAPHRAIFLALKTRSGSGQNGISNADAERAHLIALLDRHGAAHPQPEATHYYGPVGRVMLKWELHTEFVTFTAFLEGAAERCFATSDFDYFPEDWLSDAPGERVTSAHLLITERPGPEDLRAALGDWFERESLAVSHVLDDAAIVAGDFRIDPAGHQRFAVLVSPGTGAQRVGRITQRLCEIETYKAMSMLGFLRARRMTGEINGLDQRLTALMESMADGETGAAEPTLDALLTISSELERVSSASAFRFGASHAYARIVHQRIEVLREARFEGRQSFEEFMLRRYAPAMRTVESVERRLQAMTERAARAAQLLRTRVDVERAAQNQALLESMDARAGTALRLQRTVEGLSVVAISYYAVSLAAYLLYPLQDAAGLSKGMMTALITPVVIGFVWLMVRRLRRHLEDG